MQSEHVSLFLDSLRSQETRKKYTFHLKEYGKQYSLALDDPKAIEVRIINFINKMKKEGKSHAAISNYVSAIKSYYQINDVVLNVKKIGRFMPEQIRIRKDRAYTKKFPKC